MCGICGFVSKSDTDHKTLAAMTDMLSHRGPDDAGTWIGAVNGLYCGLGHRRLSVLDLSPSGHQPMTTEEGDYSIVYNGEIYNYGVIRKELEAEGESFRSNTDTEVVLKGFRKWKEGLLDRCNGMFAFAVLDHRSGELFMARDRMGQKPLYYYLDGTSLVFASELKALSACRSLQLEIDKDVLPYYLYNGYLTGEKTIYKNVYRLHQGCFAKYKDSKLSVSTFWSLDGTEEDIPYEDAKEKLKLLLTDSVRLRMISDVPLGAFLSGGTDSSLIAALAARLSGSRLKTYTISFDNRKYDESAYAEKVSGIIGSEHHVLKVEDRDFSEMTDRMAWYYDEPFADQSEIPTMLVSKAAAQDVKVVLSGDAGDELFGGYDIHSTVAKYERLRGFSPLASILTEKKVFSGVTGMRTEALSDYGKLGMDGVQLWNAGKSRDIEALCGMRPEPQLYGLKDSDAVSRRMRLECLTYLPDDILVKLDRASMSWSLEARSPLLDYRIVEYAFSLPQRYKFAGGVRKKILKDILYDLVPKELFDRPKQGFNIPVREYMKEAQRRNLQDLSQKDFIDRQGLFRPEAVSRLVEEYDRGDERHFWLLWNYYVFQLWYDRHISG